MKWFLYIAATSVLLSACAPAVTDPAKPGNNNNQPCSAPAPPRITEDTAYWGDTLRLHASTVPGAKAYRWYTPDDTPLFGQDIEVPYMWSPSLGKYSVVANMGENCNTDTTSIDIELKMPPIPCQLSNNTTYYEGLPDISVYSVFCDVRNGHYMIDAYGTHGELHIEFPTAEPPAADRLYRLTQLIDDFNPDPDELSIYTFAGSTILYDYVAVGGYAYVSHENGKVKVTFCDLMFYGPDIELEFKGSGSVICK